LHGFNVVRELAAEPFGVRRLEDVKKSILIGAAGLALLATGVSSFAQQAAAPAAASQAPAPQAAAVPATPADPFPPVNLKNFTAASPSREEVNSFLKALWGYDENRIWDVAAVLATTAPGVAKVVVFVKDKTQPDKAQTTVFFTTPDGKHAIADNVIDFGVAPFAESRKVLQEKADGATHGAKNNNLLLVEFADLQCPHCKEFQATMDNIAQDFPMAKIVFENYPITEIHPWAMRAAAEGECVRKAKGDDAFFTYTAAVFDGQAGLTNEQGLATLSAAATKAGADPKQAATCAETPAIRAVVDAQKKLGVDIGVDQTPMLVVNGHVLPASQIPYETLRKIIAFQANQDGVAVTLQPQLTPLK
jgi:protein-disulfide isomerase